MGQALLVTGACVFAATVHPEGPALLLYPLRYLTDAGATHDHVAEWQSPQYLNPFHWPIFLGAALLAISLVIGRPRPFQLLVALGVLVYAGVGFAGLLLGGNYLDYFVLGADPVSGQHRGIFWVEVGVAITVSGVMLKIFYLFAGRSGRIDDEE